MAQFIAFLRRHYFVYHRSYQAACAIIAIFFFLVSFVPHRMEKKQWQAYGKTDFAVFYVVGKVLAGKTSLQPIEIYTNKPAFRKEIFRVRPQKGGTRFLYLPQSGLLFIPFSFLRFKYAAYTWAVLNASLFLGAYYLAIWGLVRDSVLRFRYSLLLVLLAFTDTVRGLIGTGQVNGLVWLLLIAGCVALYKKRPAWSGIILALATTIKIFPAIFLLLFIMQKQWRALVSFAIAFVGLGLLSIPFFGIDGMNTFVRSVLPNLLAGDIGSVYKSTSLFGSFATAISTGFFDFTTLSRRALFAVSEYTYIILAGISFIFMTYTIFRSKKMHHTIIPLLHYSILILFILLFAKSIHKQYHFWILPLILYCFHFPLRKKYIHYHIIGSVSLLLTQFWAAVPWKADSTLLFLKPSTWVFVGLCITILVLQYWHYDKQNSHTRSTHSARTQ
ncbi:MAG TPA: glycosyltransferase family 87 protein [Patescibacteria group bacterium]|nr:glycosyltransferase family 87 protein [Patescibacteria group bacterium]